MARKKKYAFSKKISELTPAESVKKVRALLKEKKKMRTADKVPGNLIFVNYNAKDKTQTYDRTPLILIFRYNGRHLLGLNFHWIPLSMRLRLIKDIILMNKNNIKNDRPLEFSYQQLKPMLKSLGYAPCIRLYISRRMSITGIVIPPDRLMEVARLKTETFTKGRYSAEQLFQMARNSAKKKLRKNTKKSRKNRKIFQKK
jgi:hypothetical protein